ncbi:MFS transporter [Brevibacterium senegalense]|uniref:MFS transporter n=1 Tax=Brevibacterium senegalense TaxID=1033736 RepID=UPI000590209E|nr:MFS transporter [Brevibacterium senegalense]
MSARRQPLPADIWVLVSAAFIVAIGYGIIAPILPQFAASFDLGVTAASIVVSSFALFRLLFAPAGGRLIDTLGERRVYVAGLLIVAASTYAVAAAQTYWQLLLFRGLGGIGSTMFTVSAMALIIRLTPSDSRGRASSAYASSFLFGNILGPVVGGLLAGLGMRIPFVIYATGLLLAAAVVWFRLERQPQLDSAGPDAEAGETGLPEAGETAAPEAGETQVPRTGEPAGASATGSEALPRMRFRDAWRDSAYRASLGSAVAVGWAAMGARIALYPLFVVAVLGADERVSGIALTVFALGMAVSVAVVGRLTDTWGRRPFVLVGLFVLGAATVAVGYSGSVWVFFALTLLAGLGGGLVNPAVQASVGDVIGRERSGGTVLSRFQMAMDVGAIAGPVVSGVLVDAFGYDWAFLVTGLVVIVAWLLWLRGRETLPAQQG